MVGNLGDGVVFRCNHETGRLWADYYDEMPVDYFNAKFAAYPRMMWTYGYTLGQKRSLQEAVQHGTSFDIYLW